MYQRQVVGVQSEWCACVDAMERRCCELQVEAGEWKEQTEAEHTQRCAADEELTEAHRQRDDLLLRVEAQQAEIRQSAPACHRNSCLR